MLLISMRGILLIALLLNVFFATTQTFSKQPHHINFNVQSGLPSDETYHVMQDSKGFLWISTDHGAVKYNGDRFVTYSTHNGLPDDVIFKTYEDQFGRIWFISFNGRLAYLKDNQIVSYEYNQLIRDHLHRDPIITHFAVDQEGTVKIGFAQAGLFKIDKDGKLTQLIQSNYDGIRTIAHIDSMGQLSFGRLGAKKMNVRNFELTLSSPTDTAIYILPNLENSTARMTKFGESSVAFAHGSSRFYLVDIDSVYEVKTHNIIAGLNTVGSSLWVGEFKNGITQYMLNGGQLMQGEKWLENHSVTSVCQDYEGGYWFTTLESGLYYVPNKSAGNIIADAEGKLLSVRHLEYAANGEDLFFCDLDHIYKANPQSEIKRIAKTDLMQGMLTTKTGLMYSDMGLWSLDLPSEEVTLISKFGFNSRFACNDRGTIYVGGTSHGMILVDMKKPIGKRCVKYDIGRVFRAIFESDSTVIVAGFDGVDRLYLNNGNRENIATITGRVEDLAWYKEQLFVGTRSDGLYVFKASKVDHYTTDHGLPSDNISTVHVQEGNPAVVWLGTNRGIARLQLDENTTVAIYDVADGLLDNRITDLTINENTLVAGTKKGLSILKIGEELVAKRLSIYVDSASVNDQAIDLVDREVRLSESAGNVNFYATGVCLHCLGRTEYVMSVNGENTYSSNGHFTITSLAAGDYEISFGIMDPKGNVANSNLYRITVFPPVWKRPWFILLAVLLVGGVVFFLVRRRLQLAIQRERIMNQSRSYQQRALALQMKPHFVFNSLNSIQNLILKEDKEAAHRYISKFAQLMRKNLEHSALDLISLEEELAVLDVYFQLEERRFDQKVVFEKKLRLTSELSALYVPPFILQPLVENCFWHGFGAEDVLEPRITLEISESGKVLEIILEDNGIGVFSSQKTQGSKKSMSSDIVRSRLTLLEKKYNFTSDLKVEDLSEVGGRGTRIFMRLPILNSVGDEQA